MILLKNHSSDKMDLHAKSWVIQDSFPANVMASEVLGPLCSTSGCAVRLAR